MTRKARHHLSRAWEGIAKCARKVVDFLRWLSLPERLEPTAPGDRRPGSPRPRSFFHALLGPETLSRAEAEGHRSGPERGSSGIRGFLATERLAHDVTSPPGSRPKGFFGALLCRERLDVTEDA